MRSRGRAARSAALQISRRTEREGAAGADDEHHQRRRALGCADRFPGVHDHAEGRRAFAEALRAGCEIFHALKSVLKERGLSTAVGDEGGFAPNFESAEDALETIAQAVEKAGYKFGKDIFIALDPAASEFYDAKEKRYVFKKSDGSKRTAEELVAYLQELARKFPIISIEDGCAENDWDGWKKLTDAMGEKVQIVGDDLFVTNVEFLRKAIDRGVANSILVKVNQIGSLTETLDAIELARENAYTAVISHRSGETEDTTIADIAVATNAGQIKTGSLSRTDRIAKYNQLLRIEEMLGDDAIFGGKIAEAKPRLTTAAPTPDKPRR